MTQEEALSQIRDVIDDIQRRKANMRCIELTKLLESFGFEIRDGRNGNHKIYTHDELPDFTSSSYDCGHGRDPIVKPKYTSTAKKVLEKHEVDLADFLVRRS